MPVVNKLNDVAYDVYIGRGSRWGNNWSHKPNTSAQYVVATREEAIACYRTWLWSQINSGAVRLEDLAELDGKVLGCFCKPAACHGDVLVSAAAWATEMLALTETISDRYDDAA